MTKSVGNMDSDIEKKSDIECKHAKEIKTKCSWVELAIGVFSILMFSFVLTSLYKIAHSLSQVVLLQRHIHMLERDVAARDTIIDSLKKDAVPAIDPDVVPLIRKLYALIPPTNTPGGAGGVGGTLLKRGNCLENIPEIFDSKTCSFSQKVLNRPFTKPGVEGPCYICFQEDTNIVVYKNGLIDKIPIYATGYNWHKYRLSFKNGYLYLNDDEKVKWNN